MSAVEPDAVSAQLLAELPEALSREQLTVYYQPEVELSSGRLVSIEALARWEHPELGTLSPDLFLPLAERLGLMGTLTRLVLRAALAQHRAWANAGRAVPVAVNLGPGSVADSHFPALVAEMLHREQVDGRMLILDVSERTASNAVSPGFFAQLRELGVHIALDDFGTGFASLESLGGWPIDELKIDTSLIRAITGKASFRTIVRNTIDLAHKLHLQVTAEGVETEAVRSELLALGCDTALGFLIGPPMPAGQFEAWAAEHDQVRRRALARSGARLSSAPGQLARAVLAGRAGGTARSLTRLVSIGTFASASACLLWYGFWQIFLWGNNQNQAPLVDLAFFPANGMAAYCAWQVSRRAELGRASRRAWLLLALALCCYLAGNLLEVAGAMSLHQPELATWVDCAYLAFYPLALAGLLAFPTPYRTRSERIRLLLDVGTVFIGVTTVLWYVGLGPVILAERNLSLPPQLIAFAFATGDLMLLSGVIVLLARGVSRTAIALPHILIAGLLVQIVADVCNDYLSVHTIYPGASPVGALWLIALTMTWVAAAAQRRAQPMRDLTTPPAAEAVSRADSVPYLAIAGSYLLLIIVGLHEVGFGLLGGILIGALMLTALVSTRQFIALQDHRRLALKYQQLASVDDLTGLSNRRQFILLAERLLAHARQLGQPLTALVIDVDQLKQVNDRHGHVMGDRVLTDLARTCRQTGRAGDLIGRYGGDEFAMILPDTTARQAEQVATRLTRSPGLIAGPGGGVVRYTISVGLAEVTHGLDLTELLAQADLAMYEAKRAGGGQQTVPIHIAS